MQYQNKQIIPKPKSWAKLNQKINGLDDGKGVLLLALFKLTDTHGHHQVDDVVWFLERGNECYWGTRG